jgi:hypothetical protein
MRKLWKKQVFFKGAIGGEFPVWLWKSRTFPHFPQVFPQVAWDVKNRDNLIWVYIIILRFFDKIHTFRAHIILSMDFLRVKNWVLTSSFAGGLPDRGRKAFKNKKK